MTKKIRTAHFEIVDNQGARRIVASLIQIIECPAMRFCTHNPPHAPSGRPKGLLARAVSWLVISALLSTLVLPLTEALAAQASGITLVAICTEHGTEQIALDSEGKSVPLEKQHHHGRACPFCLSHPGNASLPAATLLPVLPMNLGRTVAVPVPSGIAPEPIFLTGRQPRAPPFVIA